MTAVALGGCAMFPSRGMCCRPGFCRRGRPMTRSGRGRLVGVGSGRVPMTRSRTVNPSGRIRGCAVRSGLHALGRLGNGGRRLCMLCRGSATGRPFWNCRCLTSFPRHEVVALHRRPGDGTEQNSEDNPEQNPTKAPFSSEYMFSATACRKLRMNSHCQRSFFMFGSGSRVLIDVGCTRIVRFPCGNPAQAEPFTVEPLRQAKEKIPGDVLR